jgi:hypothetical protein
MLIVDKRRRTVPEMVLRETAAEETKTETATEETKTNGSRGGQD